MLGVALWGSVTAVREFIGLLFRWPTFRRHGFTRNTFTLAIALGALPFLNELLAFALKAFADINVAPYGDLLLIAAIVLVSFYVIHDLWGRRAFHVVNVFNQFAVPFLPGGTLLGLKLAEHAGWMGLISV